MDIANWLFQTGISKIPVQIDRRSVLLQTPGEMPPGPGFASRNEGYSDDPELGLDLGPDLVHSKSSFASEPIRRNSGPSENRVLPPTNMKKVVEGNDALLLESSNTFSL